MISAGMKTVCSPPATVVLVETSPAAKSVPAATPKAGPPPISRGPSLSASTVTTAEAASQSATATSDPAVPLSALPASEIPRIASPATESTEPTCSVGVNGTPVYRLTITARIPIPPAAVAWTSDSGASASAST